MVSNSRLFLFHWVLVGLTLSGCVDRIEQIVFVDRSGCLACHRPLQSDGTPHGIEQAHPDVDGEPLTCTDCHGGDATARKQSTAHVAPGLLGDGYIKDLTVGELDEAHELHPDYLRFVNPGDFRVAPRSCGDQSDRAGDTGCHATTIEKVRRSLMSTFAGELNIPRYRAGHQPSSLALYGIRDEVDPDYEAGAHPSAVPSLSALTDPVLEGGESSIGPFQDVYLTKACLRCHLWSAGDNRFLGDFRSSGCTACHMPYANDGLSTSDDPTVDKGAPSHPLKHVLTNAIPTEQCSHCHYRGGRIGPSYEGMRESAAGGLNPPNARSAGLPLHGHDADFYLVDEDTTNDVDETPPDVHFEAGMHCIDCHTLTDVHGDGRLYSDTFVPVEIECEDCHGTAERRSTLQTSQGRPLTNLEEDVDGTIWLVGKVDGVRRRVTQIKDSLAADTNPESALHRSMGTYESGFNHSEKLECYTCHTAWLPTCYGCHVTVDMSATQRSLLSGEVTPGRVTGGRRWVATDSFVLMLNSEGRIAPGMPAEKMFFTAVHGSGEAIIEKAVRTGQPGGPPGMGHRAFHPHTVQRTSRFGQCPQCHVDKAAPDDLARVHATLGFGTDRFVETDGAGKQWVLDRIVDPETLESTVLVGHDEPIESRPLSPETISRMLSITVP